MSETPHVGLLKLKQQIGDYEGYGDAAQKQQSDKSVRLYLINKIKNLLEQLSQEYCAANQDDQTRLDSLIKSTKRKLRTIHQSLTTPTYIQESFFHTMSIPTQRLGRIYDLEGVMLEETENIRLELTELAKDGKERSTFEDYFLHIDAYVDNINQALFEREALILGDE
ncbi:hypothetical protein EH223_01900 [candidate division KSB1 bacterium]|nr:hypothetical protein [candidate division KSB1 bacterium]RQW06739.1 MAG: hypothetical protein EH223_01900 [candidate division KSB1 bacterium]